MRLYGEAEGIGGTRAVRDVGTSSDGREVVAVFAIHSGEPVKCAFRFLGTGAAGHLGARFALMAVMTALRIWDYQTEKAQRRDSRSGSPP